MRTGKRGVTSGSVMLIAGIFASIFVQGCGSSMEVSSSWTDTPLAVNDSVPRWYGTLTQLKDNRVNLGVENDTGYVYLCLEAPADQFRRQIMAPGLTIWFESDHGQKIGIHYPMGFANQRALNNQAAGNDVQQERDQLGQQSLGEMEILGPGKSDRNILSPVELRDIKAKIGNVGNQTVYELRVPLHSSADHPYGLGVSPGSTLKLEIASGKFEPRKREATPRGEGGEGGEGMGAGGRRGGGEGGFGGGYGGGGMRGGGRRGGGEGGPSFGNRPQQLDVTVNVQLSSAATGAR